MLHNSIEPKVYIAGPFFNKKQLQVIKTIEESLVNKEITIVSPRFLGNFETKVTDQEREQHAPVIFSKNIVGLHESQILISVIDDFDTGTMFEMGYFYMLKQLNGVRRMYSVSAEGHGLNIMLEQSVDGHCQLENIDSFSNLIAIHLDNHEIERNLLI